MKGSNKSKAELIAELNEMRERVSELEKSEIKCKQVENKMREENVRFQSAFDSMPDGLSIQDKDYNILFQNKLTSSIFKNTLGEKCYKVYEGLDAVCENCAVEMAFRDGKPHVSVRKNLMLSGETVYWENSANPVRNENGEIVACLEINRDITESKRAEQKIMDDEFRYRTVADFTNDWEYWQNSDGSLNYVSPACEKISGYSAEQLIRNPKLLDESVCDEDRLIWENHSHDPDQLIQKKREIEFRIKRADGTIIWIEHNCRRIKNENGVFMGYRCRNRDITSLKNTEEELRSSRQFLYDLIDHSSAIICVKDREGRFELVNRKWEEDSGINREYAIGKTDKELFPGMDGAEYRTFDLEVMESGAAKEFEMILQGEEGNRYILNAVFPVRNSDGSIRGTCAVGTNITDYKVIEEELRSSRRFLSEVIEHSASQIAVKDIEGRYTLVNQEWEKETTFKREYALGKTDEELYSKEDAIRFRSDDKKVIESGKPKVFELALDGEQGRKYILNTIFPVKDSDGRITGTCAMGTNVTEYKLIEEELRNSRQFLSILIEFSPAGFCVKDNEGRYLLVNRTWENETGLNREDVIGRTDEEIYPLEKNKANEIMSYDKEVMESGERKDFEFTVGTTNLLNNVYPLKDEKGRTTGVCSISVDITMQKHQEAELLRLRNYLSNIIDSMPSVLVGVDADIKITQWNKTAEQVTGIAPDDAMNKSLYEVFPGMEFIKEEIKTSIRSREIKKEHRLTQHPEGGATYEDVTIYPLIASEIEGAVIRIDDITEKMRIEEMMIQNEKMLSVGGLAAGMAHEINNPLAGMLQTAGVMANRLSASSNIPANMEAAEQAGTTMEAIQHYMEIRSIPRMIDTINESGKRVADIVYNMLTFARKSEASILPVDIEELISKTVELAATDYDLKKQYDFKLIEIITDYEKNLPPVPCEQAKIQQVLLNILRNGAQAMQGVNTKNPRIILRTYFLEERKMAVIEIEDNGPGMSEETRKRIFEPFFTTKPVGEGTGLGLSVSYFIITENHHGTINVESSLGHGTKFIIHLPVERTVS
ncbi:MAG: PAS domain-containing protein [Spirochaetes bacterium]|nr:PAS domain-containing protein [Spirochaetota bacterium]